jgi:glycosyltransferase involved in cell wall biosynthesis
MLQPDVIMPRVSVIIPNYNHCLYLGNRIESVLRQTFQDFEVILLDDHSTDASVSIIKSYEGHPKVSKIILNETNSGSTFKQWNTGIQEAEGEYIWIAESDDWADEAFLEMLVSQAEAYPSAGIVYCESWAVDEKGVLICKVSNFEVDPDRWKSDFFNLGQDECARYLVLHNTIPNASAVLFQKKVYLEAGMADESMRLAGDWLQWVRMLLISDVAFVARPLNYYRTHNATVRSKSGKLVYEVVECHKVILIIAAAVPVSEQALLTGSKIILDRWIHRIMADSSKTIRDYYEDLVQIMKQVELPKASGNRIREWILKEWIKQITSGKVSLGMIISTYAAARKVDDLIIKKLMKRLLKHYYPGIYSYVTSSA